MPDTSPRATLYHLLEFKTIKNRRKRQYLEAVLIDKLPPTRAAKMTGQNAGRLAKDPAILAVCRAYQVKRDPGGQAASFETIRRMELMWGGRDHAADADFSDVNLPYGPEHPGMYLTPEGKPVDIAGNALPVPPPPPPYIPPPPDLSAKTCTGCRKTIPEGAPRFKEGAYLVCGHCNHVWSHTGVKPTGPNDPYLTLRKPEWFLNDPTVADYVAPL